MIRTPKLTHRELIANLEETARKLCGRAVTVRIRDLPALPMGEAQQVYKVCGVAQKSLDGRAVIDLDPAIFESVEDFAKNFTHELAHIKYHFEGMPRRDIEQDVTREAALQKMHLTRNRRGNPTVRKEAEADAQSAAWMATVRRYHGGYEAATGDPYFAVLQILYHRTNEQ